uniref:uncharacterized protein LOC122608984 n=1 Tax=Erigeron canadensis TaxID=72917 RepID=UPI001CB9ABB4|nr:uncharacterized protein LOC122608984 [Erigeron canadensis]
MKLVTTLHNEDIVPFSVTKRKIGDGGDTSFWNDIWLEDATLATKFPRLFSFEMNEHVVVKDRWNGSRCTWNWRRPLRGGSEGEQLNQLCERIANVTIVNTLDSWTWNFRSMDSFQVNGLPKYLHKVKLPLHYMATRWNKNVPRKVNIHVWRLLKERLPTRFNLWFCGVVNNSLVCPMCFNGIETITHTMSDCRIAKKVWTSLSKWLDYNLPYQLSGVDLLEHIKTLKAQKKVKDIITTVTYAAWWYIWRFRNEAVF